MPFPRTLTTREQEVLALLLPPDGFPGVDVYRAQLKDTTVTGRCECGCATVYLEVAPGTPRSTFDRSNPSPLPIEAHGQDPSDPAFQYRSCCLREGALDSLEIVYFGDTPPRDFPGVESLEAMKLR
jgi:hypothetical protein